MELSVDATNTHSTYMYCHNIAMNLMQALVVMYVCKCKMYLFSNCNARIDMIICAILLFSGAMNQITVLK